MSFEIVDLATRYKGFASLLVASIRTADGRTLRREIEDHGNAVAVLPYDPIERTAVLVRQFRAPVFLRSRQDHLLEAVAGIQEETDPATTARREATEEAGLELQTLEHVGTTWTMPGISTERMALYLATYRHSNGLKPRAGLAKEDENITVVALKLADLDRMLKAGQIEDMKTLVLLQALKLRQPELFSATRK